MSRLQMRQTLTALLLLLAFGAFAYKSSQKHALDRAKIANRQTTQEVKETLNLQKLWKQKGLRQKLEALRQTLKVEQVKHYEVKRNKATISLRNLEGQQLNRLLGKIGALPVQIQTLAIWQRKERYSMECRCKW